MGNRMGKIVNLIRYASGLPKSIYVNFRVLPLSQAILLPIIVSRKTKLQSLSGQVILKKVKTGIVRIGFGNMEMLDYRYHRTILLIDGTIEFAGKAKIGMGSRLIVYGALTLGNNFLISGDGTIICAEKITVGDNSTMAWESIVMDTDHHQMFNSEGDHINPNKPVEIGKNVWIGARSFILKGCKIPDGCIVGANTLLSRSFEDKQAVIAGNPPRIVKQNVSWK